MEVKRETMASSKDENTFHGADSKRREGFEPDHPISLGMDKEYLGKVCYPIPSWVSPICAYQPVPVLVNMLMRMRAGIP